MVTCTLLVLMAAVLVDAAVNANVLHNQYEATKLDALENRLQRKHDLDFGDAHIPTEHHHHHSHQENHQPAVGSTSAAASLLATGHHSNEYGESFQILALVSGVVAASIFFEKLKVYIEESVESEELIPIVRHLFGELTVLGFIGLIIFILDKSGMPNEWKEKIELIHMVIFVVSLVFLTVVMVLVTMGKTMAKYWRDAEDVIIDPIHDRIALIDEYLFTKKSAQGHFGLFGLFGLFGQSSSSRVEAFQRAQFQLEYHGLRDAFLECDSDKTFPGTNIAVPKVATLRHSVSASEARRTAKLLVPDFNLADYLNSCMAEALIEIVEIQPTTWFVLYLVFIPFWAVLNMFDTPKEAIYAFLALPYCMLAALLVIKNKLRYIRSQLVPSFMHDATQLVDTTKGETQEMASVYSSTEVESGSLSLHGSHTNTVNTNYNLNYRGRTKTDPATSVTNTTPANSVALGGFRRRRQSTMEAPVMQHLQCIGPEQVNRLKRFIIESNFEFANPETIPYLQHQNKSTVHSKTSGTTITKWLHGMSSARHLQGDKHAHTATPHEQLFWFSRNGTHFLLHLIRIIMMLVGIYIAVITTTIMPALWNHKVDEASVGGAECIPVIHEHEHEHEHGQGQGQGQEQHAEEDGGEGPVYCFSFGVQMAYSVIGVVPLFLIIPQFYYIIHNFVIVANVGMMRAPKIVSKVHRSGKTRKSLRVLKLLSSMKQGVHAGHSSSGGKSPSSLPRGGGVVEQDEEAPNGTPHQKAKPKPSKRLHQMKEAARVAFQLIDDDSSGSITHEELGQLLEKLHMHVTDGELKKTVRALDNDNSGTIDIDEFMAWIASVTENAALDLTDPEVIDEFVDIIFAAIDQDGDGNVTTQELFDTLNSLGQKLTFAEVQDIMVDIDKDNSGSVDKEEFLHMIKQHAAYL